MGLQRVDWEGHRTRERRAGSHFLPPRPLFAGFGQLAGAPSFIGTALFFHHLGLAEAKGWSAVWITGAYWIHAAGSVFAALMAGPLIDRITAVRVVPAFLLPMTLALLIIWAFDDRYWAWPYLFLLGLSGGITYTALTALWAEIYGVGHLGAIRSLVVSLSVFASALGPLAMGAMMDAGLSVEDICGLFALYALFATGLMRLGLHGYRGFKPPPGGRAAIGNG